VVRKTVGSASPLEAEIGFSRAVRAGAYIAVAGTAPIAPDGGTASPGDVYGQTRRCLEIIAHSLAEAGGGLGDVVRTRIMLTDLSRWKEAARAHGEAFRDIRPASTFVEVSRFIDPDWLVEVEADAVLGYAGATGGRS
jgi:enamine deaminase RidA (YjgF/YER057c/UK114 family)